MFSSMQLSCIVRFGLALFPGCQGSWGIVRNGTRWFSCFLQETGIEVSACSLNTGSNYATTMLQLRPSLNTNFLGVFWEKDTMSLQQHSLPDLGPTFEFSGKMRKFLRSLAEYLVGLAFLCCHYIVD